MTTLVASNEAQRLAALHRYRILDTDPDPAFDNLARLAAHVSGTPASIICFVDDRRSWTKAGVDNGVREVPREGSIAALVVSLRESIVVQDTDHAPPEIREMEAVARHGVRAFAAAPILTADGHAIGAMGAFSREPHGFDAGQLEALERVAQEVMARLELALHTRELEAARTALAQRERRFRALVENGSDIVTVVDPAGLSTFVSPSVERWLGYAPDEFLGHNVFGFVHPEDVARVVGVFRRRLNVPGVGEPTRFRMRARDGSWRHLEATGTNAGSEAQLHGLIVVARDVTSRVQAEEALRRREAVLSAVSLLAEQLLRGVSWQSGLTEALGELGRAAGVTRVYVCERRRANGGPERLLVEHDWVAEGHGVRGQTWLRRGVPLDRVGLDRWIALLEAGEAVQGNARDFPKDERAVLRALAVQSMAAVPVRAGAVCWGFIGFGECRREREWSAAEVDTLRTVGDVLGAAVKRQEMQETLEATVAELERSNADLEQFAYVASHDLQEPLRMVESYLKLLQRRYEGQLDTSAEEFVGYALDGAQRMRQLVRDLLTISRVGTRGREPAPTDVGAALQAAVSDLAEPIREAGAEITHGELPRVMADATQLRQVLQNLLSNALKFRSEAPCRIHVAAQPLNGEVRLSVADSGIGIPPQHAERIFAPFQRLHNRSEYPGTGIGLALCRKIVERHGGRLWVESQPGEGATFHFTLQSATPQSAPEPPSGRREPGT
jgi:PAS domain S-box-containing protein